MKTLYADYTRGTKKTLSNQLKCPPINSEIIDSKELEQDKDIGIPKNITDKIANS